MFGSLFVGNAEIGREWFKCSCDTFKVMPVTISFPNNIVMIQQGQKCIEINNDSEITIGEKSIEGEELFNILQSKYFVLLYVKL